ncbi:CD1107 family mobile element protein, partial [Clostridioides difficile]
MKNKLKKTLTALCAALILMGGFSVPAYAQGAATEPPAEDATNDSGVIVEEKEETPPLTPKGNATLVDDYGGNKQLITVTTKSGNYFYILIDR